IKESFNNPRKIDYDLVDAQQARRLLDRLVGYNISPLLWAKIRKGLSAGRVQSVAVKMVIDREREIKAFKPEEYWSIGAQLFKNKKSFTGTYYGVDGKKKKIKNQEDSDKMIEEIGDREFKIIV